MGNTTNEQNNYTVSSEQAGDITHAASASFDSATKIIVRAVIVWLICVFLMFGTFLGLVYAKVNHIDTVVTSHNVELSQTLTAACVLIKSDPALPLPAGCVAALKSVDAGATSH